MDMCVEGVKLYSKLFQAKCVHPRVTQSDCVPRSTDLIPNVPLRFSYSQSSSSLFRFLFKPLCVEIAAMSNVQNKRANKFKLIDAFDYV